MTRPRIVISKCIEFDNCRWNGEIIKDEFVNHLKPYVEFIPVCPEVEAGLGVPREPVDIILIDGEPRLIQKESGEDLTRPLKGISIILLRSINRIDGFILKSKSPSCGIRDARVFSDIKKKKPPIRGTGIFAREVLKRYPHILVEDEKRLKKFRIRENFLTRVFTISRFNEVKKTYIPETIRQFHSQHRQLISSYSRKILKDMDETIAQLNDISLNYSRQKKDVVMRYEQQLIKAISCNRRKRTVIDIIYRNLQKYSPNIPSKQVERILTSVERYKKEETPLSVLLELMRPYTEKNKGLYEATDAFFYPFPIELLSDLNTNMSEKNLEQQ